MNYLKGYRSVAVGVLMSVAGLAEMVGIINLLVPGSESLVLLLAGIATLILRYITDTPIGDRYTYRSKIGTEKDPTGSP